MSSAAHALRVAECLRQYVRGARVRKLAHVLNARVADTACILENVDDPHNISACLRSAEAMGVHHVWVVDAYAQSPFASAGGADKGAARWLRVQRFRSTAEVLAHAVAQGFSVHATDLSAGALPCGEAGAASVPARGGGLEAGGLGGALVQALAPARPRVALAFGNEHRGCSRALLAGASTRFFLPQLGHVQSLNVSVAAALAMAAFLRRTSDYEPRAVAAHAALRGSCGEAEALGSVGAPGAGASAPRPPRSAAWAAAQEAERDRAGGQENIAALLQGAQLQGGEPPLFVVEGLAYEEKLQLLARALMHDVLHSDRILARAGLRPEDF